MNVLRRLYSALTTITELFAVFSKQQRWWLIPLLIVLLFFGILIALGSGTPLGPFIYTLF